MSTALAIVVDTTVLLLCALLATRAMHRCPAALRHAVLAAAILGAVAIPLLKMIVPPVTIAHIPASFPSTPAIQSGSASAPPSGGPVTSTPPATGGVDVAAAIATTPASSGAQWFTVATALAGVWTLGAAMNLLGLLLGILKLRRLTASCVSVRTGRWREIADQLAHARGVRRPVDILQSDDPALLVACGTWRPKVILPCGAGNWTHERVRIVLAHELAHIRRLDGAIQIVGELLRAIHWFNPLVWVTCRRLRQESEYACDDAVLSVGTEASDYAAHLLAVARHARGFERVWVAAPGIAHPSTLERRIAAMLNPRRNRGPVTRRTAVAAALAAVAVIVPLAAASIAPAVTSGIGDQGPGIKGAEPGVVEMSIPRRNIAAPPDVGRDSSPAVKHSPTRPLASPNPATSIARADTASAALAAPQASQTQPAPAPDDQTGTFVGSVKDATGAVLPGATVTMTSTDLQVQRQTTSDNNGAFLFRDVRPARYAIAVSLAGFDTITAVMAVPSRLTVGRSFALPIGEITESITVTCGQAAALKIDGATTEGGPARLGITVAELREGLRGVQRALYPTLSAQTAAPIRVGGQIQAPRKLTDVRPVCTTAPATDTSIVFVGRIGTDGALGGVRPLRVDRTDTSSSALVQSAVDALSQWTFTPTRLNGMPVPIDVTIQVNFRSL